MSIFEQLQTQHLFDLKVYRSAHNERWNILLHKTLVPLECWSALTLVWICMDLIVAQVDNAILLATFLRLLPPTLTLCLGILSFLLATNRVVGMAAFLFHNMVLCSCERWMKLYKGQEYSVTFPILALLCWVVPLMLQIVVGHWILEGNSPNLAKKNEVTFLAVCLPVLIAWSV
jgi:uncharacterized membrane protein YGL010W